MKPTFKLLHHTCSTHYQHAALSDPDQKDIPSMTTNFLLCLHCNNTYCSAEELKIHGCKRGRPDWCCLVCPRKGDAPRKISGVTKHCAGAKHMVNLEVRTSIILIEVSVSVT